MQRSTRRHSTTDHLARPWLVSLRARYGLDDAALRHVAAILRAADNDSVASSPEAAGLRAILRDLIGKIRDDRERVVRPERGVALWLARWRERRHLADLEPQMLRDVGLSPLEARIEHAKPFWRS